ncbi:transposable element Hobo transposase-like protein, partial [Leptotrombidium deliense]
MAALTKASVENLIASKSEKLVLKKEEKVKSEVWEGFKRVFVSGERQDFVCCNKCKAVLIHNKKSGTSGLNYHNCVSVGVNSNQKRISAIFPAKQVDSKLKSRIIEAAVLFAAKDLRPFSILDGEGFRLMAQELIAVG